MTKDRIRAYISYLIGFGLLASLVLGFIALGAEDETKPKIYQAYLADLNGDGHLDAFLVFLNQLNRVEYNDGTGSFTTARRLMMRSYALALGDINGDGEVNAILNNFEGQSTELLCAEAPAGYVLATPPAARSGEYLALRGDNDRPVFSFLAGCCKGGSVVYNYDTFSNPSPCLSQERTNAVALADLNGSGALDAFLAKGLVFGVDGSRKRSFTLAFHD
jgi:hypothetical protein